jgi:hypothetical protein
MTKRSVALMVVLGLGLGACGGGGGASAASFCSEAKSADKNSALNNADPTNKAGLAKVKSELTKLESKAPSAIKGDMKTLVDIYSKIADGGITALKPADEAKATAAGNALTAYMKNTCHITT